MAGHSKWANIQHRKNRQDAKRGRLFSRLIRELSVAARLGGGNPDNNPRLRAALNAATANNIAKDTIERAIRRADSDDKGASLEEVRYEGYAPGGVAVIVECMTDNRNRTVAELRYAFKRHGGNLAGNGEVAHLFQPVGRLCYPPESDEEAVFEAAAEAGAEDVQHDEDAGIEVLTRPEQFNQVREALERAGCPPRHWELSMRAHTEVALVGERGSAVLELLEALENLEDVQHIHCNAVFPNEAAPAGDGDG